MPTASSAAGWIGHVKMRVSCPGIGSTVGHEDITLEMEPGAGVGRLTFVGIGSTDVFTDWNVEGKWGYFSASFNEPDGGPIIFYGYIRGSRLKGYVGIHDYGDGCVSIGKIWGWL
jgi:hypothetical protein